MRVCRESNRYLASDAKQCIKDVAIVATLFDRQATIGSHTNQGHLGRSTNDGTDTSRHHTDDGFLVERRSRAVGSRELLEQYRKDTEACCGVGCLT